MCLLSGCVAYNNRVANNYYDQYAYAKAIPKYEKALRKDFIPMSAARLADSYAKTGNSLKAEIWYKRLVKSPEVHIDHKLQLAEVLMENGKYAEAKIWFMEYLQLNSTDKRVKRMIQACDSIGNFFQDTTQYHCFLPGFNRDIESNFSPVFFRNGIVFLSDRSYPGKKNEISPWTGKMYLDLFFTRPLDTEKWLEPEPLKGEINGAFDEGPATFTSDFNTVYFTRTNYSGKLVSKNEMNVSLLKMFQGRYEKGSWILQSPSAFNHPEYSVGHPSISDDGNTLYFVSDMPWGYGGTDLYKSSLKNGAWSDPVNLGPAVNSEGNEMFPFIAADNVLYFASDGHTGLGGLDIFAAYPEGEKWSKPENLQYPVNSSKDDFGFIVDSSNTSGFFSSNRQKNTDKIYAFKRNPPVFSYLLYGKDKKTGAPLKFFSAYAFRENGKPVILENGKSGILEMPLRKNTDYNIIVKSTGYYAESRKFSTAGKRKSEVITDSISLRKIELKKAQVLKSVQFGKKDSRLTPVSYQALDSLVNVLKLNPELQVEISSHTDSRGPASENLALSRKRADEVVFYLIEKGIDAPRLISLGYGETRLLNNCRDGILCLEEDHLVNNRIEMRVVDLLK
jgi:outer membrane protein OmpA-like peptidoglycan-associated protein/tetratricopeptide (TPR) repeat protein